MSDKPKIVQRIEIIEEFGDVFVTSPNQTHGAPELKSAELVRKLGIQSKQAQIDLEQMKRAGWGFSIKNENSEDGDFELVRDGDGNLKLAGRSLTLQFQPDLDREQIDALLSALSVEIVRELGFSKNTFVVNFNDAKPLNMSKTLNALGEVVYAEPNLIEPIAGRR